MTSGEWSRTRAAFVVLAAVAAATAWSCSGSPVMESPTAPVDVLAAADEGSVSEAAAGKITVCHKGKDKLIPPSALAGHLVHHDTLGSCHTTTCPCFSSTGIDSVAASCTLTVSANCPGSTPYALQLSCSPGGSGSPTNLGLFEARVGGGQCSTTTEDILTGATIVVAMPVTAAEEQACRQAIVGSSYYPASCPR